MPRFADPHRPEFIDRIVENARWRLGDEPTAAMSLFLRRYYERVPVEDIHRETPDTLFGAAFAHWRLAARRAPGTACLRVYNPRLEEDGWRSEHTVVEIVTDDMPFLVDSVAAELNRRELLVHRVVHPVFRVRRDDRGELLDVVDSPAEVDGTLAESFMHVEVTHQPDRSLDAIKAGLAAVLTDVRTVVADWQPTREALKRAVAELEQSAGQAPADELEEDRAFLEWIRDNNFTFLGYRAYAFHRTNGAGTVSVVPDSGLGLLRDPGALVFEDLRDRAPIPPTVQGFIDRSDLLMVTKADRLSTVHRPVHMDTVALKRFASDGRVIGEHLLIGLFAAAAYNRSARSIPLLRRKLNTVMEIAGVDPRSHDGRALINIVETYPRDELFQVSIDHLLKTAFGILHLQQRPRVALFLRRDDFERFVICLVYVPRDRYTTDLRLAIQGILERAFNGTATAHYSQLGDAPLARLQIVVRTTPGRIPDYDPNEIEQAIVDATRTWSDHLRDALGAVHGEEQGQRLHHLYGDAFPLGYRERFNADQAVADIDHLERTRETGELGMSLYRPFAAAEHHMRFKVFHPDSPIVLSQVLPMLEHLGLKVIDEVPHRVQVRADGGRTVMIHDFGLETQSGAAIDLGAIRDNFQEAFLSVWRGAVESGRFNGLVLDAGLSCRQVVILRAYCKHLRQAGIAFSQAYMERTLAAHPQIARRMVELFLALFDPAGANYAEERARALREALAAGLDEVANADEDRILRRFVNAVESTLRTNYFQTGADGGPKPYLALKIDSRRLDELPLPRPMVETFVYSPRVEGVHLRGGKVARGGIRWSDRREDFRTEILGLMKAQTVKNAVIVPVGAKGGFVVKRSPDPSDREAVLAEGIACYQTLIRGLLDLTDNLVAGRVTPPPAVVRRDDDDPYLVVAADKGTATFSDIANGISAEYRFWLGDAFASGGSRGYDHKRMGITARGAWESVKRHFREAGLDIQNQDFTVVGVGDMSGDVFGNGMLLSPHIKLIAAFNHQHIFVDPDPDPKASLVERRHLFELPRSTWRDYDAKTLSKGGAVFERRAKSVALSPEIKTRFGIATDTLTPNELIRILLRAEVDLLWFGGIGTFVKARDESNADAGDRSNDAVRVNASELRCKVIGEGANLGVTQLGRIEFALKGGRLNTDFIDNSAGVDCSDHEVNIKILLDAVVADGDMTEKQRNTLLARMTDEVGALVLRDNYLQTQAITLIESEGFGVLDDQARLMRVLERQGGLDRAVEFLPDEETLAERAAARQALTRPEIAVLFSYCKIWLHDEILRSDLPDDRRLSEDLVRYFPEPIRRDLRSRVGEHRLRRELVATSITNSLINRMGGRFVTEIVEKTGVPPVDIARAYIIVRDVFALRGVWDAIEALDNAVAASVQTTLHREVQRLIGRGTLWFLRNGGTPIDIAVNIAAFDVPVAQLAARIETVLPEEVNGRILHRAERYQADGVPDSLARRVTYLIVLPSACDIVRISAARGVSIDDVARLYFAVGEAFGFGWLRYQAEKTPASSYWQKLALAAVIDELYAHQRDVTLRILDVSGGALDGSVDAWARTRGPTVERTRSLLSELQSAPTVDLSMLAVASRQLRALTES